MSKPYFADKKCDICKGQATRYVLMYNYYFFLCDSERCDYISKEKVGYFKHNAFDTIKDINNDKK